MTDYHFQIHTLSGELVREVSLPGTATVRDILSHLPEARSPGDDVPRHLKRKLMYEGTEIGKHCQFQHVCSFNVYSVI